MISIETARSRLRFASLDTDATPDGRCRVSIGLEWADTVHEASADGFDTQHGRIQAASEATLEAALEAAPGPLTVDIVGVKAVRAFDGWVVVARLNGESPQGRSRLLGAAPCEDEEALPNATVMAVLDALNRVLEPALSDAASGTTS